MAKNQEKTRGEKVATLVQEKAFSKEKLPEISKYISEYAESLWPRFVHFYQYSSGNSYSIANSIEDIQKLIMTKMGPHVEANTERNEKYLITKIGLVLNRILKKELPLNRVFSIKTDMLEKEGDGIFTFVPENIQPAIFLEQENDSRYNLDNLLDQEEAFDHTQARLLKVFLEIQGKREVTQEDIEALMEQGWDINGYFGFDGIYESPLTSDYNTVRELELLLKLGSDPNRDPMILAYLLEDLVNTDDPDDYKKIENKIKVLFKYGWNPVITKADLSQVNLEEVEQKSPFILSVVQKAKVIAS